MHTIPPNIADAFIDMAHRIVWATVATVDTRNRPRTRILHPLWHHDDGKLAGVVATGPTPVKVADLGHSPHVSIQYWDPTQDVCRADCRATWVTDPDELRTIWDDFVNAPAPVGYDPAIIPQWADGPSSPAFGALRLEPYRVRVFPGSLLLEGTGELLTWSE